MASIVKLDDGKYRAFVHFVINGRSKRKTKTFPTRREAAAWAHEQESKKEKETRRQITDYTLLDAIRKYSAAVSPTQKGKRWEQIRLLAFEKEKLPLNKPLYKIQSSDIAAFRDNRLKTVSNSTVNRELTLLSSVFRVAKIEWNWTDHNPCRLIRKPPNPRHRERVIEWWELKRLLRELGYDPRKKRPETTIEAVGIATLLALRTGMRAGEITNLRWSEVYARHCHLPDTKTNTPRDVPLTRKTLRLLNKMRGWNDDMVFGFKMQTLSTLFRRYRQRAGLEGFTFHDTRHTAATMLARKVDVLDLCKIFGWKNTKMALVYYNPAVESLVDKLE